MSIPDKMDLRVNEPAEEIEMVAHSGVCTYCEGVVKMMRDLKTAKLQPDKCYCLFCGQRYFVTIKGSIDEWELNQWRQKGIMKGPKDHPCFGCGHFMGYESVETMDTWGRGFNIHLDLPICGNITYQLALGRCGEFEESDFRKDMRMWKEKRMKDIHEKMEPDADCSLRTEK